MGTAIPQQDIHASFIEWASGRVSDAAQRRLFRRMAQLSGIEHRYSVLERAPVGGTPEEPGGFYSGDPPTTAARMERYAALAPELALAAVADLRKQAGLEQADLEGVTHLVVASCTGFVAPGVDQILAERLQLSASLERLTVGFMGCYAAVPALRSAAHIVRSDPRARVLVVTVELSSLHLRETGDIGQLLTMLQFGDGASAALVCGSGAGLGIDGSFAHALPGTADLIRWEIGDFGFLMHLSGEVPGRLAAALSEPAIRAAITNGHALGETASFAVHAGGRSILDAVARGLEIEEPALRSSREVLRECGNTSSSTLMFVLARELARRPESGIALAFGPGLAAEGFRYRWVA